MRSSGVHALAHGEVDPKSLGQEQKERNKCLRPSYTLVFRQSKKIKQISLSAFSYLRKEKRRYSVK